MLTRVLAALAALAAVAIVAGVLAVYLLVWRYRLDAVDVREGPVAFEPGTYRAVMEHGGRVRTYLVHVPPGTDPAAPVPLLILLHGGGSNGRVMDDLTGINAIADRERFLVAFPQGVERNWNDGRPDSGSAAAKQGVDDVGFIVALIDDLAGRLPVDKRRVYAAGISNGAIMSNRLACEASDRVAAVGLVAGTAPAGFEAWCAPARAVLLIAFLGRDDPLVPFRGGEISTMLGFGSRGKVVSAAELEAFWSEKDGCGPPNEAPVADVRRDDGSHAVRREWTACRDGSAVVAYEIEGGGHTWPGGKQYLSPLLVGKTNQDLDASELLWEFLRAHQLP